MTNPQHHQHMPHQPHVSTNSGLASAAAPDTGAAPAPPQRKATKSRKRQRTPPQLSSDGHHLALMPSAFMATPTTPNEHPFPLPDPSLLSPTAAYPPVTDPLSSSLPTLLTDSLRLASPAASGEGGLAHDESVSACHLSDAHIQQEPACRAEHQSIQRSSTVGTQSQVSRLEQPPQVDLSQPLETPALDHSQAGPSQQRQQTQLNPDSSTSRPRFVARRHSDVMPMPESYRLNTSWTLAGRETAVVETPSPGADGTTMVTSTVSDSRMQSDHPYSMHAGGTITYSTHPHVFPPIPAVGSSSFHPHSIAPPPPPPLYPLPPTMPCHDSPNPTAKKKKRSEPPHNAQPPHPPGSSARSSIPTTMGLGLFDPMSVALNATGAGAADHTFCNMLDLSQATQAASFGFALALGGAGDTQNTLIGVDQQTQQQHGSSNCAGSMPRHDAQTTLLPHNYAQAAMQGGGAHPFMFHMTSAASATETHAVAMAGSLSANSHMLEAESTANTPEWPPKTLAPALLSPNSTTLTAHPSPFRPGGLLDPTTNTAPGSTFLFDVSLMNPSPMASPYMVRSHRPGSSATSLSSDSRTASVHSGLLIHSGQQHVLPATPPNTQLALGSGAAETAKRALAGSTYHSRAVLPLDTYELARALGGPIHMELPGAREETQSVPSALTTVALPNHAIPQCNVSHAAATRTHDSARPVYSPVATHANGSGTLASALGDVGNRTSTQPLSPTSLSLTTGPHCDTALNGRSGLQQQTPHSSTSPVDPSALFFTDASPTRAATASEDCVAASNNFGPGFDLVSADHLDPLLSAAHGDDLHGFEQLVQALLMNHPDAIPAPFTASAAAGVTALSSAEIPLGMSSMDTFASNKEDIQVTTGHPSYHVEMQVDPPDESQHGEASSEPARPVAVLRAASQQTSDPMDVDESEPVAKGRNARETGADGAGALLLPRSPQLDAAVDKHRRSRAECETGLAPLSAPARHFGQWRVHQSPEQQQDCHVPESPSVNSSLRHDEHTAAAALMLVELHNRAAPEHRRMSTIDVPPPSPPSIVRLQPADRGSVSTSPSALPLTLSGSALFPQQRSHLHPQHPANILVPDTFTPTTRTLSDRQLQTVVESMLYATSLQGSCHSQGCWHMYTRAYFSTHDELPRDAAREPARWVGRWGLCKVTLYTPRVAQKSYGSEKRFLCPPPMISIVGSPLFPESPLGQPMGLPPAPANDKVPRWLTMLPEVYQPQVIMLMRGEIEGAELPEDMSTDGAYGGLGEGMDVIVSTQRGERVMLSEAGWRAAVNAMSPAALAKLIASLDRARDKQVHTTSRMRTAQDDSTNAGMEDAEHLKEDDSAQEDEEDELVTASASRNTRSRLRSSVRVRTRSQARSTAARYSAAETAPSPRKSSGSLAPVLRARRGSTTSKKSMVVHSSSSEESDQDMSDEDAIVQVSTAAGKSNERASRGPDKTMVSVEKYCTESTCAEVPAERWVFRNVWISDSERRKEFSCVFQLSEPTVSSTPASSQASDSGKRMPLPNDTCPPSKQVLEFASKPIRVISKPSKKKIEVRSTGASPSAGIIYAGSLIALFNRIRSQTVSTKYLSVGSSVSIPSSALTREVLSGAEVNKPQKWQGEVDLDQDRFLANATAVKHVFPGAIKSEQLKYLCSTASWTALRIEVVDEFERDSPYLNLPQFNCQCEVCTTAAEFRDALTSTCSGVSGASTPELGGSSSYGVGSGSDVGDSSGSSTRFTKRQSTFTLQCLTRGKIVSFNQTVVLIDPVTGLRSREFILRRVDNNTTVILAEGHLPTSGATAAASSTPAAPHATKSGRATTASSKSMLPSDRSSSSRSSQPMGSSQFPPLRPYHTHPWVLHTYRQAGPCASHDPHAASATSHALSIIQVSGSRSGLPDAQTMTRAFEAPKLDPIAQLHKVAFQLKDSSEYTGAFLTVIGNEIGLYIPQPNHMSFVATDEPKRTGGARARRNSCPAQPSQLSEVGSTQGVRTGTLTVEVTEGSVWTIVNSDKVDRSFYIPHPKLLELDGPVGADNPDCQDATNGADKATPIDTNSILSTATPSRACVSSLSALSPFPRIAAHTITTAARSYMSDGTPNLSCVHGMSTTIVLDGDHFLDHPFNLYLADMKCVVDWESNTRATVTLPSPATILRHLFAGLASTLPLRQSHTVPSDASLSPKYSAFIVTRTALQGMVAEERVDLLSSGNETQLMSASQHPGGVAKAPIPVRLLSERIIGVSLGSNPISPPLRPSTPPTLASHSMPATGGAHATTTPAIVSDAQVPPAFASPSAATVAVSEVAANAATSSISPPPYLSVSSDTHLVQPSTMMLPLGHAAQSVSPHPVMVIAPPAGTAYPSALTTVAANSSLFGGANQPFPAHIQHLLQRGSLPAAFPNMPALSYNPLDGRFVASAAPAAFSDALGSSRYLRSSLPIQADGKVNTVPRQAILTSPLSYVRGVSSAIASAPSPTISSQVTSSITHSALPTTPAPAHSHSGKTSATQRTPKRSLGPTQAQQRSGKLSPDSSSLSSAASTPPMTDPATRCIQFPLQVQATAQKASGTTSSAGRRGHSTSSTSKRPAAPEPPSVVPLPVGVVTVDMVTSPSLLLPLYFVRADGVVYETGRSFLFRLDETVLGSGSVVVLE